MLAQLNNPDNIDKTSSLILYNFLNVASGIVEDLSKTISNLKPYSVMYDFEFDHSGSPQINQLSY